jgi:hypothetical protein
MYNAHNIPISRVSLLFETKELRHLSRYWMPNFLLGLIYKRFEKKYDEFFNPTKNDKLVDNWYELKLKNLVNNYLPALYYSLVYGSDTESKRQYKERYGKEPETTEDLNRIVKDIEKILDQLKVLAFVPENKDNSITFSKLVALIENSRGVPVERSMTLWDFKQIHDIEIEKWQQSK